MGSYIVTAIPEGDTVGIHSILQRRGDGGKGVVEPGGSC